MLHQFTSPYKALAIRLNELPNGFPATKSGAELKLLQKLYNPDEAALAARLSSSLETPREITARLGHECEKDLVLADLKAQLKTMARKGLIAADRIEAGIGYGLMPFVVGVYEMQAGHIDEELARLFENYYQESFGEALNINPSFHRVIPIGESVQLDMEIKPFENARLIVDSANAWGVLDCICRTQKALIGDPCDHPIDVCMIFSQKPGAFDYSSQIQAISHDQAIDTLRRSAKAGLVHSVTNSQNDIHYICNCCTCSCGILRGLAEFGIANAIARSAFVNQVDGDLCLGCESCPDYCQFDALYFEDLTVNVDENRCTGCGVCVPSCPEGALVLVRRSEMEILPIPNDHNDWNEQRLKAREL